MNGKQIPSYFSGLVAPGAHISVIYPDEQEPVPLLEAVNRVFNFVVGDLFKATLGKKTYIGLTAHSPDLQKLQLSYGLNIKLNLHGHLVPSHITIATFE